MYDMDDKNYSLEYREARSNVVLAQFQNPSHNRDEFRRFVIGDFSQPKINKSGFFLQRVDDYKMERVVVGVSVSGELNMLMKFTEPHCGMFPQRAFKI